MAPGDQLVKIFEALEVFGQQDQMVGPRLFAVRAGQQSIDPVNGFNPLLRFHIGGKMDENVCQHLRVVAGAMMVEGLQLEVIRHRIQLVVLQMRIERAADRHGIDGCEGIRKPRPRGRRPDEPGIEGRIVRNQDPGIPAEGIKLLERLFFEGRVLDHVVGDAGEFRNFGGNRFFRVDKDIERIRHFPVFQPHGANLGDAFGLRAKAGGLNVENDEFAVETLTGRALHHRNPVVDVIGLDAVKDLDFLPLLFELGGRIHGFREGLNYTVIGNGDCLVSPIGGARDERLGIGNRVHSGHFGM